MSLNFRAIDRAFDAERYVLDLCPDAQRSGGNLVVTCPRCDKPKLSVLVVDRDDVRAPAWRCFAAECSDAGRTALSLVRRLEDCDMFRALEQIARDAKGNQPIIDLRKLVEDRLAGQAEVWSASPEHIALPDEFIAARADHRRSDLPSYFRERGIGPKTATRYGIGWCESGYFRNRIVVPVMHEDEVAFFVARYMRAIPPMCRADRLPCKRCGGTDEHKRLKKTLYPKGAKPGHFLYNYERARYCRTIRVVEGVLDVDRVEHALDDADGPAVASALVVVQEVPRLRTLGVEGLLQALVLVGPSAPLARQAVGPAHGRDRPHVAGDEEGDLVFVHDRDHDPVPEVPALTPPDPVARRRLRADAALAEVRRQVGPPVVGARGDELVGESYVLRAGAPDLGLSCEAVLDQLTQVDDRLVALRVPGDLLQGAEHVAVLEPADQRQRRAAGVAALGGEAAPRRSAHVVAVDHEDRELRLVAARARDHQVTAAALSVGAEVEHVALSVERAVDGSEVQRHLSAEALALLVDLDLTLELPDARRLGRVRAAELVDRAVLHLVLRRGYSGLSLRPRVTRGGQVDGAAVLLQPQAPRPEQLRLRLSDGGPQVRVGLDEVLRADDPPVPELGEVLHRRDLVLGSQQVDEHLLEPGDALQVTGARVQLQEAPRLRLAGDAEVLEAELGALAVSLRQGDAVVER